MHTTEKHLALTWILIRKYEIVCIFDIRQFTARENTNATIPTQVNGRLRLRHSKKADNYRFWRTSVKC